jgi:hypothetical protein
VALKSFSTCDEGIYGSFNTEAHSLKALHHPDIVKYFGTFSVDGYEVIEMEYVGGRSFRRLVKGVRRRGRHVDECVVREIFFQAATALRECHRHGIIHHDVKPDHLLLTDDGTVKIIDFGIADVGGLVRRDPATTTSSGTEPYVDPAFLDEGRDGPEFDVWSLGVTLFEVMTGQLPFTAPELAFCQPVPCVRGYSTDLVELCRLMLGVHQRIKTKDVILALEPLLAVAPVSRKVTVKFKRLGSVDIEMARFPIGTTVGKFLEEIERPDERQLCVKVNGAICDSDIHIADLEEVFPVEIAVDEPPEPPAPPARPFIRVKCRPEGDDARKFLTFLPDSATISDLSAKLASERNMLGVCVKVDGYDVGGMESIKHFGDQLFDICLDHDGVAVQHPKELDLVFVIDATGSMGPAIEAARGRAYDFARAFRLRDRELGLQIGCVCYRDQIDSPSDGPPQRHALNPSILAFKDFLSTIRAIGGGDGPEDWAGSIESVLGLKWRPTAIHALVWIADAPAHGLRYSACKKHQDQEVRLEPLVRRLAGLQVSFFGLSINPGADRTFREVQKIYRSANRDLFCSFKVFRTVTAAARAKPADTLGDFFTETVRDLVKAVLPFDPMSRAYPTGPTAAFPVGRVTGPARLRAVTFETPGSKPSPRYPRLACHYHHHQTVK